MWGLNGRSAARRVGQGPIAIRRLKLNRPGASGLRSGHRLDFVPGAARSSAGQWQTTCAVTPIAEANSLDRVRCPGEPTWRGCRRSSAANEDPVHRPALCPVGRHHEPAGDGCRAAQPRQPALPSRRAAGLPLDARARQTAPPASPMGVERCRPPRRRALGQPGRRFGASRSADRCKIARDNHPTANKVYHFGLTT